MSHAGDAGCVSRARGASVELVVEGAHEDLAPVRSGPGESALGAGDERISTGGKCPRATRGSTALT